MLSCNRTGSRGYRHGQEVPQPDLCFPQPDFTNRMVGALVQHNVGPRPRRLNVLPEIGAMMLTPQPVSNLARVSGWEVPVVVEI